MVSRAKPLSIPADFTDFVAQADTTPDPPRLRSAASDRPRPEPRETVNLLNLDPSARTLSPRRPSGYIPRTC